MDGILIGWRELLILVIVLLAVYVAEMLLLLRRGGNAGWRLWQRGAEAQVQNQALIDLRREVAELRAQVQVHEEKLERSAPAVPEAATPYGQAIAMAQQGCDVASVASGCGITRGEAELIVALYRDRRSG